MSPELCEEVRAHFTPFDVLLKSHHLGTLIVLAPTTLQAYHSFKRVVRIRTRLPPSTLGNCSPSRFRIADPD
jgi:hypothetical protein